jgi:outer membrane immunogenic protein
MRKIAAAGAVIVMLSCAASADGPGPLLPPGVYQYPPVIRLYSWNGPYVGGHIGAGWNDTASSDSDGGILGGAQVGFNLRAGWAVLGLEAQWTGSGADDGQDGAVVVLPGGVTGTFESQIDWLATLTARLGVVRDRSLLYVKGGAAWVRNSYDVSLVSPSGVSSFDGDETRTGWALGIGYEHAFRSAWSARLEYLLMDFGSDSADLSGPAGGLAVSDIDQQVHALTRSINYRFDWPIAGPLGTPE